MQMGKEDKLWELTFKALGVEAWASPDNQLWPKEKKEIFLIKEEAVCVHQAYSRRGFYGLEYWRLWHFFHSLLESLAHSYPVSWESFYKRVTFLNMKVSVRSNKS